MQKWEYGFLTFVHQTERRGIGGKSSIDHVTAYFRDNAIASYEYTFDMNQNNRDDAIYDISFNKLGEMGWELVIYDLAYSTSPSRDGVYHRHEKICFKRPVE